MSSLPVAQTALSPGTETLEDRFRRLEATWLADIEDTSCHTTIVNHPAFREIVSMGEAVVPLMLRDLEEGPRLWVWALLEITGVNPVSSGDCGKIAKMGLAWLRWAREQGYKIKGIEDFCPGLRGRAYQVTGSPDADYNCIAWAAGVTDTWWSPTGRRQQSHWPAGVPRQETVTAVQAAFASLGYAVCDHAELEPGHEKVALFHNPARRRVHAARQLQNGRWTSKLGILERIEHALRDLECASYGAVVLVMKRPLTAPSTSRGSTA
jgi:hypothetical protein